MTSKIELGKFQELIVVKQTDFGVFLNTPTGAEQDKILLPKALVPQGTQLKDVLNVFVYKDSEDRPIATTLEPDITLGGVARLYVKEVTPIGAFLEWGLMKDLLVPFKEQKMPMREGKWYLVYVHVDHVTGRIVASARIDKYLDNVIPNYSFNQEVDLLVAEDTEIGYKVIINNTHWGLVYHNEVFQRLEKGEHLKGYIKEVRKDEKIDVSLTPLGYQKVEGIAKTILDSLKAQGGYAAVHDKSEPELIYSLFRCSKKAFKQAIGALYKKKIINIEPEGIRLIDKE